MCPVNARFQSSLGLIYGLTGDNEKAVFALRRSIALAPGAMWRHFWLGHIYQIMGQDALAIEHWRRAAASPYFVMLGQNYSQKGVHIRTLEAFQNAIAIDPSNVDGHYYLGRELLYRERWDEAIHEFRIAVQLAPQFSRAYYFWAVALYGGKKDIAGAIEIAETSLKLDRRDLLPYLLLGDIARENSRYGEAESWYLKAAEVAPINAEPLIGLAHIKRDQGDVRGAIAYYHKAAAVDPENSDGYAFLGDAYRRQGRYQEAIQQLDKAISLNSEISWYHLLLARAYRDAGFTDKAIAEYRLCLSMESPCTWAQSELEALLR